MRLEYMTRGNTSPQRKPQVYFTGHPADYALLEEIAGDILACQNCAVYYDAHPGDNWDEEELFALLDEMKLFVIPVTTRFLTGESRAMQVELPFAIERHIPLLPLLQEPGLEGLFNRKCGDMQLLGRCGNDSGKTGNREDYEGKLKKYLSSVLLGDELAEKIRNAFDAYVFLSYRKKDKKYAQKLMRLIHQNEFCRNIAIWYDEYLIPGENFSAAINEAMEKSSLFTLAVTPNLLEDGNYVMTVEYPKAMEAGKPVLPVELEETDWEDLQRKFPGVSCRTVARDGEALSRALLENLRSIAIRENDTDPRHNFFIGLAYLNGVDVEIDRDQALELITGAAEAGLSEAMEKLADMYRTGTGVARDYRRSIHWRERLAGRLQKAYQESRDSDIGYQLVQVLYQMAYDRQDILEHEAAGEAFRQMKLVSEDMVRRTGQRLARYNVALACENLGQYESAGRIYEELFREDDTVSVMRRLAVVYSNLSFLLSEEDKENPGGGEHAGDIARYEQRAMELRQRILERLRQTAETESERADLADQLRHIGGCQKTWTEIEPYYQEALDIRRQLWEETKSDNALSNLASSYDDVAGVYENTDREQQAEDFYQKALAMDRELLGRTESIPARRQLATGLTRLGGFFYRTGRMEEAQKLHMQAWELRQDLYSRFRMNELWKEVQDSCEWLDLIGEEGGLETSFEQQCQKALEENIRKCEEEGTREARQALAESYKMLAQYGGMLGNVSPFGFEEGEDFPRKDATLYQEKAVALELELCLEKPTGESITQLIVDEDYYQDLHYAENYISYYSEDDYTGAAKDSRWADIREKAAQLDEEEKTDEIREFLKEYVPRESLVKQYEMCGTVENAERLADSYSWTGGMGWNPEDPILDLDWRYPQKVALENLLQELPLRREILEKRGLLQDKEKLAACCSRIGDCLWRVLWRREEARPYYEEALVLYEEMPRKQGKVCQADILHSMGDMSREEGKREEADRCHNRCLELLEEQLDDWSTSEDFQKYAATCYQIGAPIPVETVTEPTNMFTYIDPWSRYLDSGDILQVYRPELVRKAEAIWRQLSKENPENSVISGYRDDAMKLLKKHGLEPEDAVSGEVKA